MSAPSHRRHIRLFSRAANTYDWELWIGPDESLKYISPSCEWITGYTPEEFMNKPSLITDIIFQEDVPLWDAHFHDSRREMEKQEVEFRIKRKDGEVRWIEHICHPVHTKQGKFLGFRASNRDITRRKVAEEALRKSKRNLLEAQRIAHLGSWDWDIVTNELLWSDEVYRIFGLTPRQFGASYDAFLESVHPEDREAVKKAVNKSLSDPEAKYSIEHRIVRPGGLERIVHERGEVTFNNDGKPVRMIGIVHDITDLKMIEDALKKALSEIRLLKDQLEAENIYLREELKSEQHYRDIIGDSDSIKYMLLKVEQVARTNSTVLILGETGTGKSLVARAIHNAGSRSEGPFINVNCAALPANLIESELFGREKGAFTGAQARQIGRFELANRGTIFLDEVGEMPIELQTKLLRVLQDREFERLGNPQTIKVDVRVIASTNRNLKEDIGNGRFREDLFYRLNVFPITLPPLRKRKEDIPDLVNYFVQKYSNKMGKSIDTVSKATMQMLQSYSWPGNVRELENVIERAVIVSRGKVLQVTDKLEPQRAVDPKRKSDKSLQVIEKDHILQALTQTNWRIEGEKGSAVLLGINPSTLRGRMRKLGIKRT
jgi:formate hydrogenlyase transcriptional activator